MYDRHCRPIDALDPKTGKMKNKNVTGHQQLKLD